MPLKPFDPPLPEASAQASHHSKGQISQRLPPLHPDDMPSRIARVLGRGGMPSCVQSVLFTVFSSHEGVFLLELHGCQWWNLQDGQGIQPLLATHIPFIVCKLNFHEHFKNNNINSNNNLLIALHLIEAHALNSYHGNPFKEEIWQLLTCLIPPISQSMYVAPKFQNITKYKIYRSLWFVSTHQENVFLSELW